MLVPLTRETFHALIPAIATGAQYLYFWGKFNDFLQRLLISVVGILSLTLLVNLLPDEWRPFLLLLGIAIGLYWLWGPVASAARRNYECRRYKYSGFWQGEVLDVFVTEDVVGTEETVNQRGELVIVENRERRLNLEVGDETGFSTIIRVPLRREHKAIAPGDIAEMLVMSNRGDLGRIAKVSDIFLPRINFWVSDYPYLRRDLFEEVSQEVGYQADRRSPKRRAKRR
ncbi:phosphate ABC transporter permease [Phormidium sp. CCY1219]|uniref:phosphate ABC transporter permease n=1 Tax=Phormidium sp. CCY1219 TaxID=2886104 RepID=UPI002D1F8F51|nr:phosphate ABC transporter permease [Phormidium sp. CCY1219]MEB3829574.1 phosphate ABC transporter permease [Phormidium sp. CCY1219]